MLKNYRALSKLVFRCEEMIQTNKSCSTVGFGISEFCYRGVNKTDFMEKLLRREGEENQLRIMPNGRICY